MSTGICRFSNVKRVAALAMSALCATSLVLTVAPAAFASAVATHTQKEVADYIKNSGVTFSDSVTYAVQPSTTQPYAAGELSTTTRNNALKMLNNARYIAGLQSVSINSSYASGQQASALVMALNGGLSHYPSQPSGLDSATYQLGYSAAGQANLAMGGANLNYAIVHQWLEDSDSSNIDRVGHRRWCLNPKMGSTNFGAVGYWYSMQSFNSSNSSATETNVAWPAAQMPLEYFGNGYAWSLSTGTTLTAANVRVTLTRVSDNKQWTFSTSSTTSGVCYVNNDGYGQKGCIIFKPNSISYSDGDKFQVSITGAGSSTISYTVEFFTLENYFHTHSYTTSRSFSSDYSKGIVTKTCACGDTSSYEVPVTCSYDPAPTCTASGWKKYTLHDGSYQSSSYTYAPALGHDYQTIGDVVNGAVDVKCNRCNATANMAVITGFSLYYNSGSGGSYYSALGSLNVLKPEGKMGIMCSNYTYGTGDSKSGVLDATSSDPSVVEVEVNSGGTFVLTAKSAGKATVTIYPKLNPTVKKTVDVYVNCLEKASFSVSSQSYTGSQIAPDPTVTYAGTTLVKGTDYTIDYGNNVNVADGGTVTITGCGAYTGSLTKTFKISAISMSGGVAAAADAKYTGSAITPAVTVTLSNGTVVDSKEYSVVYSSNVNVGTAQFTVTGKGNYTGTLTKTFDITPATLTATYAGESNKCNETPTLSFVVTGFVNGETAATAAGYTAPVLKTAGGAAPSVVIGETRLVPTGGSAKNYTFSYTGGTLSVVHLDRTPVGLVAPTCTEAGSAEGVKCTGCGTVLSGCEVIEAPGHNIVTDPAVAATCVADGRTEGSHCTRCDDATVAQTVVGALGHNIVTDAAVAATCIEDGKTEGSHCTRCNDMTVAQAVVPAKGHAYVEHAAKDVTCTEDGWDAYVTCKNCDFSNQVVKRASGHAWSDWTIVTAAGPGTKGEKSRSCGLCFEGETAEIPAEPTAAQAEAAANSEAIAAGFVGTEATVEKAVTSASSDEGPSGTTFGMLQARTYKVAKTSVTLKWTKVSGAKKYIVYGNLCGKGKKYLKIATVGGTSFKQSKLGKGKYYKYLVVAVDSKGRVISASKTIHAVTKGGKRCNYKSVTTAAKKGKVSLSKGKSFSLKAKAVRETTKLKASAHRPIKYETSNARVATVSAKGVVKAKGKGTCYVYAYAQNGVFAKVKVTVK